MKSQGTHKYHFSRFVGKRHSGRISIRSGYQIGLLDGFLEDNGMERYGYVQLYYDPGNMSIGMRFSRERTNDSYIIVYNPSASSQGSITARKFFRAFGIDHQKFAGQYEYTRVPHPDGELFVIDLKESGK